MIEEPIGSIKDKETTFRNRIYFDYEKENLAALGSVMMVIIISMTAGEQVYTIHLTSIYDLSTRNHRSVS
jgi:hypothetical protein